MVLQLAVIFSGLIGALYFGALSAGRVQSPPDVLLITPVTIAGVSLAPTEIYAILTAVCVVVATALALRLR